MKYMGFKLGPALKLNNHLEKLRQNLKSTMMNKVNDSNVSQMPLKTEYNWAMLQQDHFFFIWILLLVLFLYGYICMLSEVIVSFVYFVYIYETLSVYIFLGSTNKISVTTWFNSHLLYKKKTDSILR